MKCSSKLLQFMSLLCAFTIGAITLFFGPMANAQCRDPYTGIISLKKAGVCDAVSEVACRAGDANFQSAVLLEYQDEKPQIIYGDDGSKLECTLDGCSKQGETGKRRAKSKCTNDKAERIDVKVFGKDERNDSGAFLNVNEQKLFSGIGRIECTRRDGMIATGTAFHLGSYDTLVTNAHNFENFESGEKYDRSKCVVAFYDAAGNKLETVAISFVESRWDEPGKKGDPTNDIAIIKLVKESATPSYLYGYKHSGINTLKNLNARLVGFHGDVNNTKVIRQTFGKVSSAPTAATEGLAAKLGRPVNNPENMLVADFDANHGTSGAPAFDDAGEVIGIYRGSIGSSDRLNNVFSPTDNFNSIIRLDAKFHRDLQRIRAIKPSGLSI